MKSLRFSLYLFILLISLNNFSEEENISLSAIDCDNTEFGSTEPIYAETEEEKIRRLEKELEQALAQFDNCIVEESKSSEESGGGGAAASASTTASGENNSSVNECIKSSLSSNSTLLTSIFIVLISSSILVLKTTSISFISTNGNQYILLTLFLPGRVRDLPVASKMCSKKYCYN